MSVGKHTPGPWRWQKCMLTKEITVTGNNYLGGLDNRVSKLYPAARVPEDQALANACLIAAAPEMLEALKAARIAVKCCFTHVKSETGRLSAERDLEMVDAAIAKATGKELAA